MRSTTAPSAPSSATRSPHGFDDQGSHFDADGQLRDWWTEEDRTEFTRRAQVLVDQFDEYAVVDDLHVNGRLTLGENIADFGGLKIAHDALREALADKAAESIDGLSPSSGSSSRGRRCGARATRTSTCG